jgi:hypothetical protein
MQTVHDGQCGLCAHFGEHHGQAPSCSRFAPATRRPRATWTTAAIRGTPSST